MELKQNTTIVVLGASGDLAKKKTVGSSPKQPLTSSRTYANMAGFAS
jgi:glucose-6-phosphate 1-dehydrogenase